MKSESSSFLGDRAHQFVFYFICLSLNCLFRFQSWGQNELRSHYVAEGGLEGLIFHLWPAGITYATAALTSHFYFVVGWVGAHLPGLSLEYHQDEGPPMAQNVLLVVVVVVVVGN